MLSDDEHSQQHHDYTSYIIYTADPDAYDIDYKILLDVYSVLGADSYGVSDLEQGRFRTYDDIFQCCKVGLNILADCIEGHDKNYVLEIFDKNGKRNKKDKDLFLYLL